MPSPADKVIAELDTLPDPMADLSPADRVLAEKGLYLDYDTPAPRQAYHYDEANDTGLIGEMYGRFTRDAAGAAASLPELLGTWAFNLERKLQLGGGFKELETPEDTFLHGIVGKSIRDAADYITPTPSVRYRDHWLADFAGGVGTVGGYLVGSKGAGAGARSALGGSKAIAARHAAKVAQSPAISKAGLGYRITPAQAAAANQSAVAQGVAKTMHRTALAGGAAQGMAMSGMEGWNDAYLTLLAKAKAEGRDKLTEEELDQAWLSMAHNMPAGLTESLGATAMAARLFSRIDRSTKGAWGRGWRHITKTTAQGALTEAAQESFQTAWLNLGAAHVAKYQEDRDAFENLMHSATLGASVGGFFGLLVGVVGRKGRLQQQITDLENSEQRLRESGNDSTADVVARQAERMRQQLAEGTEPDAAEALDAEREAHEAEAAEAGIDLSDAFPVVQEAEGETDSAVETALAGDTRTVEPVAEPITDPIAGPIADPMDDFAEAADAELDALEDAEATTETASEVAAEEDAKATQPKRKPMTPEQRRRQEQGPDVLDWIEDTGSPIPVPPRSVRVKGGGRRPGKLATGHAHDQIESTLGVKDPGKSKWGTRVQDGKGNLDQVVDLYNRQHGTELDEDGFLDLVSEAITRRRNFSAESKARREQQETDIQFEQEIREGDGPAAKDTIPTQELVVGDEFTLNGEKFEVVGFDPDTDTITVQDGRKFGRQQLRDEGVVKVDKGSLESDGEVDGIGADWDAALPDAQAQQEAQEETQEAAQGEAETTAETEVGGVRFINGGVDMDSDLVALVQDKVSKGMAKAMNKLGLSEGAMHIELRPGGDPNTSGIFAEPDEAGNLDKIVIHPEVFGAHLQRIKALNVPFILNEEIFHQIQNRAIHKEWLESGQTVPFLEFRQQYLRNVEAEMDADEKKRIELVYMGQAKMDGVAMKPESIVMEGTRMAFQGKLFGAITEATAGVRPKLTAFIELLVRYIRGIGPSKALQAELDKAVKVLGQMRKAQKAADGRAQRKQKAKAAPEAAPATDYTAEQEAAIEEAINKAVNSVAADPQMRDDLKGPAAERVAKDLREGKVDVDKPAQLFNSAKAGAVDAIRKSTAQKRGGGAVDASLEAESDEGTTLGERTEDATAEGADMGARRSVLREQLGEVFDQLTAEEQQVLEVAAEGASTREGAKRIGVKSAQTYSARLRAAQAKAQDLLADKDITGAQDFAAAPEGEGVDADVKLDKQIIRENLEKGLYNAEVLPERIAQEISGSGEGSTILAAENVARRSHRSIQQDHEEFADGPRGTAISAAQSIGKQARPLEDAALAEWAEQQGILYSDANKKEFIDEWGTQGERGGVESIVIFNDDTQRWTKINNLLMHSSQTEFLHRLAIHNYLFPNESYKLEGYVWQDNKSWRSDTPLGVMTDGGKPQLLPVISQPNVKHVGDEVSILESTAVLEALGGKWDSVEGGFVFEDGGFLIGDAHEENVLRRENDSLAFIDTDIRLLLSQKNDRLRAFAEGESEVEGDAAPAPDSDFETDTDPTSEQEQMVLGLKDGEEAIPPDINVPVWEKFKALMRGEWSGTDKLRRVGLGGLADRIELYEAKRGEFSGKLLETMRQWAKPLSREQIVEAHREALEYFAVREDYGGSLESNTLRRKLEEAKRDRDKARRKRDESDAAQRDALDPTELEARQQAVADADAKVQRLKRELDQRVAQEQRDAESRANAVLAELSDTATDLVRIMGDTSEQTGAMADSLGIKVQLPNGAWRRMVNLGRKHFPRVFSDEVVDAINNPAKFPELYAKLQGALVDGGYALDAKEAEKMLLDMQHEGEMAGASFLANAEMARGMRLPAEFYSTSPDTYFNFVNRFADRAAQIHAFGQSTNTSNDAFDTALKASKRSDQETRDFIKLVRGAVYRIRPKGNNKFYQRLQTFTTGGFLSGPFTAIRDVASGVALSAETFGALNTARAMWQTFGGHTKAAGRNLLRIKDGDFKWYQFQNFESSPDIEAALRLGAVREDFVEAMLLDERINDPNATDKLLLEGTNKALAFKRSMDSLARVTTLVASVHWLRTTQSLSRNNPEGRRFKQRVAALKRLGIKGDAVAGLLAGDVKAEEDFARKAVAEKQYTYSITQHPLFLASPDSTTKIFFQFQRWTFQRGRDLLKNVILPATHGTKVGGERVRDFAPVLRFAAAAALTGELLSLLREWLTDKERREALNEEIANADDTKAALIVDRVWKDMVMSGGLGLLGDYGTMAYELTDRGPRWRDPLAPPAVNLLKQLRDTVTSIAQQGLNGDAAVRELGKWINTLPPVNQLYGFSKGMTRRVMPDLVPVHAATRDRNFVRTLARRFGEEHDLDVEGSGGSFAKDEFTEQKKQLEEALLTGDIAEAREIKQSLLDDGMELTAIRSSVRMRHPIRIGMVTKPELRRKFMRWAKQRVPSSVERIERTQKTYELTARRLGLF